MADRVVVVLDADDASFPPADADLITYDSASGKFIASATLADAHYPNALLLDGTRAMTGALDMGGEDIDDAGAVTADDLTVAGESLLPVIGTYTPTVDFLTTGDLGTTYVLQAGYYIRIGDHVWVTAQVDVDITHTTASGAFEVSLPFQVKNDSSYRPVGAILMAGWTLAIAKSLVAVPHYNNTYARVRYSASGANDNNFTTTHVPTGTNVEVWATVDYEIKV